MKTGQMSAKAFLVIFTFFLMPGVIPGAAAQQKVTMPPLEDYVLRFTTPDAKEKKYFSISTSYIPVAGERHPYTSASVLAGYIGDKYFYHISIAVFEDSITVADWLDFKASMGGVLAKKIHETGYNEGLGGDTHFQYFSPIQVFRDGKYVDIKYKNPTGLGYVKLYDGRVILEFDMERDDEGMTAEDIARFDEFAQTISVAFEDIFDTTTETYAYSSPDLMLHLSANKFTKAKVEMLVPKDWIVEETTLEEASAGRPLGRIILDIAPYEEPFPGEAPEGLRISLEGLPDQKLKPSAYQEVGARALAQIIQSPQKRSSIDVSDEMDDYIFGGHCLSDYAGSANSNGVMATIYEGRNDEGLPIKVLHLSAGGFYLACNYIYSASPERFDQNKDMVLDLLKGLGVDFIGPPLKR